jgi:hypothetical protein
MRRAAMETAHRSSRAAWDEGIKEEEESRRKKERRKGKRREEQRENLWIGGDGLRFDRIAIL